MQIAPLLVLLFALPVLLLGEQIVQRTRILARLNVPTPVVGGFVVAVIALSLNLLGRDVQFQTHTSAPAWTFWVTTHGQWKSGVSKQLLLPLVVVFYTTLGLSASWELLKKGGMFLILFILSTGIVSLLQNLTGLGVARGMGEHSVLGLMCGSVSLMGGFSTAIGFTPEFERLGFTEAAAVGVASATFGMVMSNVVSAPLGTLLIRRKRLAPEASAPLAGVDATRCRTGIVHEIRSLDWTHWRFWRGLILLLVCAKLSAYVSHWIELGGAIVPVQVGAMVVGIVVRNLNDALRVRWIDAAQIDRIGSVTLALFLSVAMMTLDLSKLAAVALPMLVILTLQVGMLCAYAFWLNWRLMGKDYEAAVTSTGLLGFGLGATPNAIASMKSLTDAFGPAPRAFLVVPVTGAFLSDVLNVLVITIFINLLG